MRRGRGMMVLLLLKKMISGERGGGGEVEDTVEYRGVITGVDGCVVGVYDFRVSRRERVVTLHG